jgi:hypothetical protein
MIKKITALKGASLLKRKELKTINGGIEPLSGGFCQLTYTLNGQTQVGLFYFTGGCSQQSGSANAECVDTIQTNGGGRCRYDCGCDGWGA